jgi:hypothetical protein
VSPSPLSLTTSSVQLLPLGIRFHLVTAVTLPLPLLVNLPLPLLVLFLCVARCLFVVDVVLAVGFVVLVVIIIIVFCFFILLFFVFVLVGGKRIGGVGVLLEQLRPRRYSGWNSCFEGLSSRMHHTRTHARTTANL